MVSQSPMVAEGLAVMTPVWTSCFGWPPQYFVKFTERSNRHSTVELLQGSAIASNSEVGPGTAYALVLHTIKPDRVAIGIAIQSGFLSLLFGFRRPNNAASEKSFRPCQGSRHREGVAAPTLLAKFRVLA